MRSRDGFDLARNRLLFIILVLLTTGSTVIESGGS